MVVMKWSVEPDADGRPALRAAWTPAQAAPLPAAEDAAPAEIPALAS